MKKITLLSAATAATFAFAPAAAQALPTQSLKVKLTNTTAGTSKKPKSVGITVSTGTTSDSGNKSIKQTIEYAKIILPKGIKLNYKPFPACDLPASEEKVGAYCQENAPKSAIGTGSLEATVVDVDPLVKGVLTPFIGTNGRLIIRTKVDEIAVVDQPLIGKISTSGGAYAFDFKVPTELQTPLDNADQQINDFTVNFKAKKWPKNTKRGLVELVSCPKGGYVFKGEFKFKNEPTTVTTSYTVPCKQGK